MNKEEQKKDPLDWLQELTNPGAQSATGSGSTVNNTEKLTLEDLPEILEEYARESKVINTLTRHREIAKKEILRLLATVDPTKESPYLTPDGKLMAWINVVERKSIKVDDAAELLKLTDFQKILSVSQSVQLQIKETGE